MQMKSIILAAAFAASGAAQAQYGGALGGFGDALQNIGRQQQAYELQRALEAQRHEQEMQRLRLQHQQELDRQRIADQQALQARQAQAMEVERRMEAAHPGWRRTVNTPPFSAWLQTQPASVKALADSPRPEDAILLLDLFKRDESR